MNPLFYELLYNGKIKRWLELLDTLEEKEQVTTKELGEQTGVASRTIFNDLKKLKSYFDQSICLIGDESGHHFSLIDPQAYYQKKEELLGDDALFLFLDQLAAGKRLENHQWVHYLNLSSAKFTRIKRHLQELLKKQYDLKLVSKTNQLIGEEASIRQLFYDFYFTLPIYPKSLATQIKMMQTEKLNLKTTPWQLDVSRVDQWLKIASLRIAQGYCLPDQSVENPKQAALVQALDQAINVSLPAPEKAALFLLGLDERQFLNSLTQKEFIRTFSPGIHTTFPVQSTEVLVYQLFDTYLSLLETFFQLPKLIESANGHQGTRSKAIILDQLLTRFRDEKNQYSVTVCISYQLIGPLAVRRWIQVAVEGAFRKAGLHVVDRQKMTHPTFLRQIQVTNDSRIQKTPSAIHLSVLPSKKEIERQVSAYF
ncbi:MAG TPA: M protein trans-acting positive regulator [Enterococcus sp.]|nr:M protein trans-acting positive regulator [Enterococcus sp.]